MAESLAQRVKRLREQMGWNKKELAERAGLHPTHIGLIEREGRVGMRPETLAKIANAFGTSVAQLLGEEQEATSSVELLQPYARAIQAARDHGIDPDALLRLIETTAGMFAKR